MIDKLPQWSRPTLETLTARQSIPDVEPRPIQSQEENQLKTMAWIVDTYIGYDENPAIDKAMNQPGRVVLDTAELNFDRHTPDSLEASLLGQDKQGRPVAFIMHRDPAELEGYSVQKLDDVLFVQGGHVNSDGSGLYRSGGITL